MKRFRSETPDLILLDVMMPKKSGYDVCREIRSENRAVPVLILRAKGEDIDKVLGLEFGADDYITNPFGIRELLARVSAALRRSQWGRANESSPVEEENFPFGPGMVDTGLRKLRLGSESIPLTQLEYRLLLAFHHNPDRALSRDHLLNEAWRIDYCGTTRTLGGKGGLRVSINAKKPLGV